MHNFLHKILVEKISKTEILPNSQEGLYKGGDWTKMGLDSVEYGNIKIKLEYSNKIIRVYRLIVWF